MVHITDLPVELVDHIVSFIPPTRQRTLSNLSLSCKSLYNAVTPTLYRCLRVYFCGRATWEARTNALKELAPPGSYTLPQLHDEPVDNKAKDKSVSGHRASGSADTSLVQRRLPTYFIREIEVGGYWSAPLEQKGSNFPKDESVERVHGPFLKALLGVLYSIDRLDSFTWKVIAPISPEVTVALARFDSLKIVNVVCDTHMVEGPVHYSFAASAPSIPTMNPSPLFYNSLHTLRALQLGDHNQAVQFGDIIRSPTNWKSLRHVEINLSPGFVNSLIEIEPLEPDILFALFRSPVAPRGSLKTPKLSLDSIKMRDVLFQKSGIDAVVAAVNPATLKSIDLCYCQEGGSLLKQWEKNALLKLERLVLKDEPTLPVLTKFLKQFGPEGECHSLKSLDLTCAALPPDRAYDHAYPDIYHQFYYPYDTESDMSDYDDDGDDINMLFNTQTFTAPPVLSSVPKPPKDFIPQPWRRIRDLRGCREEGWGLERLFLDMTSSISAFSHGPLIPKQDIFFEGFWNLRELACPVSYEASLWTSFVETISKLPNLTNLCLLNIRPEPHLPGAYLSFHHNFTHFHLPPPSTSYLNGGARSTGRATSARGGRKKATKDDEPDKAYVDALAIAAANRLHVHSNGVSEGDTSSTFAATVSSSSSSSAAPSPPQAPVIDSWRGKLKHIGIRSAHGFGTRPPARTWRIVVQKSKPPKNAPKPRPESERKKSLRSSTKRQKVEEVKDWRVTKEGEWECRLVELRRDEVENLGIEVFGGRENIWR